MTVRDAAAHKPEAQEQAKLHVTLRFRLRFRLVILHGDTVAAAPLVVHFAVSEDRPLVFIKAIKLLSDKNA